MYKEFSDYNEIECPHCGNKGVDFENLEGIVSYWGEDGADERTCGECDKTYFIKEVVSRDFKVAKKEEALSFYHDDDSPEDEEGNLT
jgi:DNA-directed RNA polymerase subunit RPC12/RpoP